MTHLASVLAEDWAVLFEEYGGYDCMSASSNLVGAPTPEAHHETVATFDHGMLIRFMHFHGSRRGVRAFRRTGPRMCAPPSLLRSRAASGTR